MRFALPFVLLALLVSVARSSHGSTWKGKGKAMLNPTTGRPVSSWGPAAKLSHEEMLALAEKHGFVDPAKAAAIAMRESGGHPDALVDTVGMTDAQLHQFWGPKYARTKLLQECSSGLWQINTLAFPQYDCEALKDPDFAAQAAFEISKGGTDWKAWGG